MRFENFKLVVVDAEIVGDDDDDDDDYTVL